MRRSETDYVLRKVIGIKVQGKKRKTEKEVVGRRGSNAAVVQIIPPTTRGEGIIGEGMHDRLWR